MAVSGYPGGDSLALRLVAAAVLVTWGARTDRPWTVVVAATLANPTIAGRAFAMLIGVVPLLRWQRSRSRDAAGDPSPSGPTAPAAPAPG